MGLSSVRLRSLANMHSPWIVRSGACLTSSLGAPTLRAPTRGGEGVGGAVTRRALRPSLSPWCQTPPGMGLNHSLSLEGTSSPHLLQTVPTYYR